MTLMKVGCIWKFCIFRQISYKEQKKIKTVLAKVKQIRIRNFRHSCASLLINNSDNITNITHVAKYFGHAKIGETLNIYSYMFKSRLESIVDTINKINVQ